MLQQFINNADGIAIMYGYLAIIITLLFISWGVVIAIDWILKKKQSMRDMNYRSWKQNGNYRL